MKAIHMIFLASAFVFGSVRYGSYSGHTGHIFSDNQKKQQISLHEFSISDSCEQCSGGIELMLIADHGKGNVTSYLNKVIIDSLTGEAPGSEHYSIGDFENNRIFGKNDCIGVNISTLLNVNANSILSLTARSEGSCGTSVSDFFPAHHVTIDLNRNEPLVLKQVIKKSQWKNFEQFVLKYARVNKIDNVHYIGGEAEQDKHDQRKITYLPGLRSSFYVKEKALGVYTLIDDKNPPDMHRKSREGTIGIEYMNVELPLSEIKTFIDPGTAVSSLISK